MKVKVFYFDLQKDSDGGFKQEVLEAVIEEASRPKPSSESSNPNSASTISNMSSSNSSQNHESKQEKQPAHVSESPDSQTPVREAAVEEGEEEEVGECPFCLFMKEGGCRDEFVNWENCVEEAEKNEEDVVERCAEITFTLKKCMEAHRDYYAPLLRAEEEAMKEFEREGKEGVEATNQTEKGKGIDGSATLNGSDTDSQGKTVNGSA